MMNSGKNNNTLRRKKAESDFGKHAKFSKSNHDLGHLLTNCTIFCSPRGSVCLQKWSVAKMVFTGDFFLSFKALDFRQKFILPAWLNHKPFSVIWSSFSVRWSEQEISHHSSLGNLIQPSGVKSQKSEQVGCTLTLLYMHLCVWI